MPTTTPADPPALEAPEGGLRGLAHRFRWIVGGARGEAPAAEAPAEPEAPAPRPGTGLEAAFDALPDPTVVVGPDGRVLRANRAVEALAGHAAADLDGADLAGALVAARHRDALRDRLRAALALEEADGPDRLRLVRRDGSEVPVEVAVAAAADGTAVVTLRDARAASAADARRRTLQTIVDAVPDTVVAIDHAGRAVFRNRAGVEASREAGARISAEELRQAKGVLQSGEPTERLEGPGADGRVRLVTRVPVHGRAGGVVGVVVIARDVTAEKTAEARLREDKQAAEAAARANSDVLATTSHEVRTLMSGVTGMTALLLDTALDEEQRDFVDTIRTSSDALLAVVNDVLDLSKIEAGKLELEDEPFEVRRVVRDALAAVAQQAAAKGLELGSDVEERVPGVVVGDAIRVRQVLANLLTNAVKFTDAGSVRVRAGLEDGALVVSVADTGVGIAPDRLEALFEPFVQADASTARTHGGTGLGLAICRRLVEAMGGALAAESTPGHGSAFRVTLPLRTPAEDGPGASRPAPAPPPETFTEATFSEATPAEPAAEAPTPDPAEPDTPGSDGVVMSMDAILPGARVLLAEDNPTMQKVTALTLKRLGYRPDVVGDGQKAVFAVRAKAYDVVLMDVMMPVMDGLEATRAIRADPGRGPAPAIVALTANAMKGDRERCLEAGCDAYLSKPVDPRHLASTIEWAIRERKGLEVEA